MAGEQNAPAGDVLGREEPGLRADVPPLGGGGPLGEPSDSLDEQPYPPRFWWLKRIALAWVLFLLILGILRVWWEGKAERRWHAAVNQVYDDDPSVVETTSPIPDESNLVWVVANAAAGVRIADATEGAMYEAVRTRDTALRGVDVETLRANNAEPLAMVRKAVLLREGDWGASSIQRRPDLGAYRRLARLLSVSSMYFHRTGKHGLAVQSLREMHAVARAVATEPSFLGPLVAMAIYADGFRQVEAVAPTLCIRESDEGGAGGCGSWEELRALIDELLDDGPILRGWKQAVDSERATAIDLVDSFREYKTGLAGLFSMAGPPPGIGENVLMWVVRPAVELDGARVLEKLNADARAMRNHDWGARKDMANEESADELASLIARPLSRVWNPLDRMMLLHFRNVAERRMAAIALAIRWYQADHGERPASLEELVPEYLEALPADPFAREAQSFGYRPGEDFPRLYSVGPDSEDDGGEFDLTESGWADTEELDLPFFLDVRPASE